LEQKWELLELKVKLWDFLFVFNLRFFNRNTCLKGSDTKLRFDKQLVLEL